MPKNQAGFGIIGIVLVTVIIIAGVVGWKVYKNHNRITVCIPPNYTSSCGIPLSSVPAQFRDRAKSSGIYCPGWAAKPSEAIPELCAKISK